MLPFADLVVLELANVLAGPSVGQFFAELGATVWKVESPRTQGDVTRRWRLPTEPDTDRPAYFTAVNWGKQSLALDLAHPDGRALLHQLAAQSDVVLTSFRPGTAARLGADAATLRALDARLVVASISGYGSDHLRAGYDAVVQAESGWMFMNGYPDGPPTKLPVALVDVLAAHQLKQAILVALLQRARTGEGAHVHVSLLDAAVSALVNQASNWLTAGHSPQRMGSAHPNIAPYGSLFRTADGHDLLLAVGTDRQFAHLCTVLGLDGLPDDPRFA
ncbi:MAG: CaiB/BaiF CoA-transferase family protein, partial [Bacteroidota bacterium]